MARWRGELGGINGRRRKNLTRRVMFYRDIDQYYLVLRRYSFAIFCPREMFLHILFLCHHHSFLLPPLRSLRNLFARQFARSASCGSLADSSIDVSCLALTRREKERERKEKDINQSRGPRGWRLHRACALMRDDFKKEHRNTFSTRCCAVWLKRKKKGKKEEKRKK